VSTSDHVQHNAEELKGKAKEGLGDATGNEQLQAEGQNEETAAKAKQAGDHVKDAVGDIKDALRD
jgi:uncharacterized protein YjbJ (UPF0337 family)